MASKPGATASRWAWLLALGGAVAVAAALRLFKLGAYGLWRDEAEAVFTALAAGPLGIAEVLRGDVHAPLYFYLLRPWVALWGRGEFAVRLLSALCGIVTVPLLYVAGKELYGSTGRGKLIGLLAAWSGAILPLHVVTSRTARMYSLLPLAALLTLLALHGALQRGKRWAWPAYVLAGAATLYTHYWGALWVAALGLYGLFQLLWEKRPRREWLAWAASEAAIILLFLPWAPTLLGQLAIQESVMGPWLAQQSLAANLLRLFGELTALAWPRNLPYLWMLLLALGTVALSFRLESDRTPVVEVRYPIAPGHNLVVLGLFVPMVLGALLVSRSRGLTPSYVTMAVYPALCLLLGSALASLRRPALIWAAVAALSFLWLRTDLSFYRGPVSAMREVAQRVQAEAGPGDVVVVAPDYLAPAFSYYFAGGQAQMAFPWLFQRVELMDWLGWADRRQRAAEAVPATLDAIAAQRGRGGRVWLVAPLAAYPGDPFFEQMRALKAALDQRYRVEQVIEDYRGVVETADIVVYGTD